MLLFENAKTRAHDPCNDPAFKTRVLEHYRRVGPLLEASFGGDPIVYQTFLHGFDEKPHFHHTDIPLSAAKLEWLVARWHLIEVDGWAPLPGDEDRLRFARLLLEHTVEKPLPFERMRTGARILQEFLHAEEMAAVPLVPGGRGVALWIPLADAPHAAAVRLWLHALCNRAVAANPDVFTLEPNVVDNRRIHLHVSSNAKHRFSGLPYSLRGARDLPVVTPVTWDELLTVRPHDLKADTFARRLATHGDVFASEVARIGEQKMPAPPKVLVRKPDLPTPMKLTPHGHIITAAIAILEDGQSRSADDILAEALKQKLVPAPTTRKYVYSALIEYIARTIGHGRKPQIVQDAERRFRINEPQDDWPDVTAWTAPAIDADTKALIARLQATATGENAADFELACCDAFARLGFRTTHLGGHAEPDGTADAQLGPLGYRVMLECKTSTTGVVSNPDAAEAAKFVAPFEADYATLIGPDFSDELELIAELNAHKVTAFTVADLVTLLSLGANGLEIRSILQPGFASDRIGDLVWERRHGRVKRVATIVELVLKLGWDVQCAAAEQNARANAPHLNVDAAMILVGAALPEASHAATRDEVEAAFDYLTNPLVAQAVHLPDNSGIVILH